MDDGNRSDRLPFPKSPRIHRTSWLTSTIVALGALIGCRSQAPGDHTEYRMSPIGTVKNQEGKPVELHIQAAYAPGLLGLDTWSHVDVFYWFDKNDNARKRSILQVHPRRDPKNPLTGVFACRAPVRPNLIALTTCRVLSVHGNVVTIDGIDAFDGTPILDLKPHIPGVDPKKEAFNVPAWTGRQPKGERPDSSRRQ